MNQIPIDWIYALIGGLLIGCSAAFYLFFNGRVAGISGILGQALAKPMQQGTGIAFLVGLIGFPALASRLFWEVEITMTSNVTLIILGGLIVGFGTRLGSGCTSGHGVCGMSRLSIRSISATCIFMCFAGITVYITHHILGVDA